jgi:hypothetical protein
VGNCCYFNLVWFVCPEKGIKIQLGMTDLFNEMCFLCEEKDRGSCIVPQVVTVHALVIVLHD